MVERELYLQSVPPNDEFAQREYVETSVPKRGAMVARHAVNQLAVSVMRKK